MDTDQQITSYILAHGKVAGMLNVLRSTIKKFPFTETVKWGRPVYVYDGKNLVGLGAFKHHVGLWFFQGALLKDQHGLLHNAQEGKTKAMRQIHFSELSDIDEELIMDYLKETIENQKKGLYLAPGKTSKEVNLPDELSIWLKKSPPLLQEFSRLTPGRQKEYGEYISEAKREKTKIDRLHKITPLILQGKGLNDNYKKR